MCFSPTLGLQWSDVFFPNAYVWNTILTKNIEIKNDAVYVNYQYFTDPGFNFGYKIRKYSLTGTYQWQQTKEGDFESFKMAVDNNGNSYLAGSTVAGPYPKLIKYDNNGILSYERQMDSTGVFGDIKIGSDNKAYVSAIIGPNWLDAHTVNVRKYNDDGTVNWNTIYTNPNYYFSKYSKIAVADNFIYVTAGFDYPTQNQFRDIIFLYDATGRPITNKLIIANQAVSKQLGLVANNNNCFILEEITGQGRDWFTSCFRAPRFYVPQTISLPGLYTFSPTGPTDAYGVLASMNVTSITGSGEVSVTFSSSSPINTAFSGGTPAFVSSYSWYIEKANTISDITAEVRFDYTQIENAGISNPADVKIYKRDISGTGSFIELPTTVVGTELRATVSSFGEFILGSDSQPLPVELSSFTSLVNKHSVELKWSTTSEQNNRGFSVERKKDTGEFTEAGFVNGSGNSTEIKNYSFTDLNMQSGKYQYRLKQIDYNGNFKYYELSNEVVIDVPKTFALSQNYPNPFNPATKINYEIPKEGFVSLKVYDISGKEVSTLVNEVKQAGYYTADFNGSVLASGIYFYVVQSGAEIISKRMILVK
ncbi:MAG: T9SS type A sorting domain-containing protein [Ignavibacteria bacterium]|nr:T9SS type A sorting domain-containing protein [Ignavibacteria bacterium]